jgi:hypothetical protein
VAGELFSKEAQRKGLAGLVVDGPVRDIAKVRGFGLPVYSRSICPASGTTRRIYATQVAIQCGGVVVQPGDVLFGDDDGIVVAGEAELVALIDAAEAIQKTEAQIVARMERGESLTSMLNFEAHYRAIEAGRDSRLAFAGPRARSRPARPAARKRGPRRRAPGSGPRRCGGGWRACCWRTGAAPLRSRSGWSA